MMCQYESCAAEVTVHGCFHGAITHELGEPFAPSTSATPFASVVPERSPRAATDWRHGLPTLGGALTMLRERRPNDAPALMASMSSSDVGRFISPPSATLATREHDAAGLP